GTAFEPAAAAPPEPESHAKSAPEPPPKQAGSRMGALSAFAYIYKHPSFEGLALGSIRMGTSVSLKSPRPVEGKGCKRGWYAVEPRGFACLGPQTTLDLDDPYFRALESMAPGP